MKKRNCSHRYCFWRWLILTIARTPRLYVLVWGILLALLLVAYQVDVVALLLKVWP